ncbi:hypothetical protein ACU639_00780 [Streptomyces cynarae]|uniref:hypothetical protein n=1 Tax=Streptomyces cynarae TaxID=2981134 RepID=UPI00406C6061
MALAVWRKIMEAQYARVLNGELTFTEQRLERTRQFLSHLGQDTSGIVGTRGLRPVRQL